MNCIVPSKWLDRIIVYRVDKVITDEDGKGGKHRLTVHFTGEGNGGNFHSVIWDVLDGTGWRNHLTITHDEFQPPSKHRRWVRDVQRFNPETGRALIQVAEGDVAHGDRSVHYWFSWREWDLIRNEEVQPL